MAIGDETFDDWATETTQSEIKKLLETKLKAYDAKKIEEFLKKIEENTDALKGSSGAGGVDFTQALKSANLTGGGTGGGSTGGTNPAAAVIATLSEGFNKATGTPGGTGGGGGPISVTAAKEEEVSATKKVSSGLFNFGLILGKSTVGMISAVAVLGALGTFVHKTIDSYRELIGVGQSFEGSMLEMRRQAAQAGMSFEDFANVMSANSAIVKAVGNTAFIALQARVREVNGDFGHFGFTVAESGQIVADYAERQLRAGRLGQLTTEQQALETQKYMFQLTELSKITGRNRKEMAKEMQEISRDVDIFTAQALLGAEGGKKFREGLERAGPAMTAVPGFGKALTDAAAMAIQFGNQGLSAFGRVSSIVSGKLSTGMDNWVSALKRGESGNEHLAAVFGELGNISGDTIKSVALLARSGDEGAKSMMGLIQNFTTMSDEQKKNLAKQLKMTDAELENKIATSKAALNKEQEFTRQMLAARSKWDEAIGKIQLALLEKLGPPLLVFSEQIGELVNDWLPTLISMTKMVIDNLEWFVGAWVAFKAIGIVSSLISFGTIIASFVAGSGTLMAILGGIGTALSVAGSIIAGAFAAVTLPVWGLVAAVAAGVAGLIYFSDEIISGLSTLISLPGLLIDKISEAISSVNFGEIFNNIFKPLFDFFTGLPGKILGLISSVIPSVGDVGDKIAGFFGFGDGEKANISNASNGPLNAESIANVKAENIKVAAEAATQAVARDGGTTAGGTAAANADQITSMDMQHAAKINEGILAQLTAINKRAEIAQDQRDMQIREQKKMGRNPNVGLSMTN